MASFMEFMIIAKATWHYATFNAQHKHNDQSWALPQTLGVADLQNFIHSFLFNEVKKKVSLKRNRKKKVRLEKYLNSL